MVTKARDFRLSKGNCYMAISDRDLAEVIKSADHKNFKIGKDIGLLSFDDTPLKEVLAGGITTISTDFGFMGKQAAQLIKQRRIQQIPNPLYIAYRNSL
jgi:DNA-binding LacI/PurR family transcriptional regulator